MSLEKNLDSRIEVEPLPQYDIYLAGPWEKHQKEPYKSLIKEAFTDLNIYDPEDHQDGDYFIDDLESISKSKYLICYAPTFPNSASIFEAGYFYHLQEQLGLVDENHRCKNILVIWNEDIQPNYAKKWYERASILVSNTDEAIEVLKEIEPKWSVNHS